MEIQYKESYKRLRRNGDIPIDSGALLRAVELTVEGLGRSGVLDPPEIAAAGCLGISQTAERLGEHTGMLARVRAYTREEFKQAAKAQTALLAHLGDSGWLAVGRGRRPVLVSGGRERRLGLGSQEVKQLLGTGPIQTITLEPRLQLEPLSRSATGTGSPWARLRALMALEASELGGLVLYAVILGAASLAVPIAVQVLVNTIALGSLLQPLVVLAALLLGVLTVSGTVQVIESYAAEVLQRRMFVRVAEDFARRLPEATYQVYGEQNIRELATRFFEVVSVQKSMGKLLLDGLTLALQTAVGLLLLGFYHPLLLAFDVALLLALSAVVGLGYGAVSTAVDESAAKYRTAAWLQTVAAQPLLFKRASGAVFASVRADALTRAYLGTRRRHYRRVLRQLIGGVGVQVLTLVALLGLGGWLVIEGELTLGQLVAAELVVGMIVAGFAKLGRQFETGYDLLAALDKLGHVLDLPRDVRAHAQSPQDPLGLELCGVTVQADPRAALEGVHARIEPGARVRLTGGTERQRRVLLELLAGIVPSEAGVLRALGTPADVWHPAQLRECALLVGPGDFVEGTVLDNLRVVDPSLDEDAAMNALRAVRLSERVAELPAGLRTQVLSVGSPFTPSEVARLALARALVASPGLLVLDHALDAIGLDGGEHQEVLDRFLSPKAPWTVIATSDDPKVRARLTGTIDLNGEASS